MEKFIGNESVTVEEIVSGNIGVGEDGGGNRQSVCPNVTLGEDVGADDGTCSPGEENNQILREEQGSANITSTPNKSARPICTKKRSSVLAEHDEPLGKAVMVDVASGSRTVGAENCREGMLLVQVKMCPRVL